MHKAIYLVFTVFRLGPE